MYYYDRATYFKTRIANQNKQCELYINNSGILQKDSPVCTQPSKIKYELKKHQLAIIQKCLSLESGKSIISENEHKQYNIYPRFGIIADKPGTGKSFSALGLAEQKIEKLNDIDTEIIKTKGFTLECNIKNKNDEYKELNINIFLVPNILFTQWKTYIQKHTKFTAEFVYNRDQVANLKYDKNLILVSAGMYQFLYYEAENLKYKFQRLFVDEPINLHLKNCNELIKVKFCWFITSSFIKMIENGINHKNFIKDMMETIKHYPDCHNLATYFNNVDNYCEACERFHEASIFRYNLWKFIIIRCSDELLSEGFELYPIIENTVLSKNNIYSLVLHNIIKPDILKLVYAGNINEAVKKLNFNETDDDNLIKIVTTNLYNEVEDLKDQKETLNLKRNIKPDEKQLLLDEIEKDLKLCYSKIDNIKNKLKENNIDPITLETIENPVILKCCQQIIDFKSLIEYSTHHELNKSKCPFCRTKLELDSMVLYRSKSEDIVNKLNFESIILQDHTYKNNLKADNLIYILKNNIPPDAKVVFFNSYPLDSGCVNQAFNVFDKLVNLPINYAFQEFKNKKHQISWFKSEYLLSCDFQQIKILTLSENTLNSGLDLSFATHLIIYHKLDKDTEEQLIHRLNRPGRFIPLVIYRLLEINE